MPKKSDTITDEATTGDSSENPEITITDQNQPDAAPSLTTGALEEPGKAKGFTVKLKPTKDGDETVGGFAYPDGDGFGHWSLERQGYEVEFTNLTTAQTFMTAAAATGGLEVAADSPTRLKQN